ASKKDELFDNLLTSIESEYGQSDSFEQARFDEWKKNGPTWQKESTVQDLIIWGWLDDHLGFVRDIRGMVRKPPLLSKIHGEVWTYFKNNPPEETKDGGKIRAIVIAQFERVISSCMDLPEPTREELIKYLKEPTHRFESEFRRTVGLPIGGKDGHEKI
ncbi:MAG: hypothetical protein ACXWMH_04315, partial [Syntrophales bacterium]